MRIFSVLALVLCLGYAQAQVSCPGSDDGLFNGLCCDSVQPNLPAFPDFSSDAQWICIRNCDPDRFKGEFKISEPSFIDCDRVRYEAKFVVDLGGSFLEWEGELLGKYARTFNQVTPNGNFYQVWRFLVNGDFTITSPAIFLNPCLVPSCFATYQRVHFVGHVDYACRPTGNGFDVAVSLQHLPGCISHGIVSSRPNSAHQDFNYYLIAPGANFAVGANQGTEPQGTILGEDFRASDIPNGKCFSEERIAPATIETFLRVCACIGPFGSMQWAVQKTELTNVCSTSTTWVPFSVTPPAPDGINLQVVGRWNLGANGPYPQNQTLIHYQGFVAPTNIVACNPDLTERQSLVGVATKGARTFGFHPSFVQSFDNAVDFVNLVDPNTLQFSVGVPATSNIHFGLFVR